MKKRTTSLLFILLSSTLSIGQTFIKSISREALEYYLSKSVNIQSLNDYVKTANGIYPSTTTQIVDNAENSPQTPGSIDYTLQQERLNGNTFARYNDILRVISKTKPKLITDCVSQWGAWDWNVHMNRCSLTVRDIKNIDNSIIVQASVNEYMDLATAVGVGKIPAWVWQEFNLPDQNRNFNIYNMMFSDWNSNNNHWWSEAGLTNGLPNAIVPDINKLESKMWFYYQGRKFIDMGCESLNFSQVELMNNGSYDPTNWNNVFKKLKTYADTKSNVRFVLITGHTYGMKDNSGKLAFDFHTNPIRPSELGTNLNPNGGGCDITSTSCNWGSNPGKIYTHSLGGITPSGWSCTSLPSIAFIDNYGNNSPLSQWGTPAGTGTCNSYHFDEITWFALQNKSYRDDWLKYAYYQVQFLDPVIYFSIPVKRDVTYKESWYPAKYLANNPNSTFLPSPPTIGNITGGYIARNSAQMAAGYGQEDVIKEILDGKYDIGMCAPTYYLSNYYNYCGSNCWTENMPRYLADVNGDGKDDIIGFGNNGVYVSFSTGTSFSTPSLKINDFGYQNGNGWSLANHLRLIGDVNGDGKADIVGFGYNGVMLSLSTGTGYSTPSLVLQDYNYCGTTCWTDNHPRFLADVNGDGKDDIIGFGNAGTYVSYSTGTSFTGANLVLNQFGYNYGSGWQKDNNPRLIGDVNGDGKADIVGFANNGVILSLSTGSGYTTPTLVLQDFNYNNGIGWTSNHPRFLEDVDGDGKDDIIGFGNDGVYIAYSTGNSFTGARVAIKNYGYEYGNGWNATNHPRLIGHINDDNKADIVGFGDVGVYASTSIGDKNSYFAIMSPPKLYPEYGYQYGNGWLPNKHPRLLGDIDGDGKDEIVGFGYYGVYVMNCGYNSTAFKGSDFNTDTTNLIPHNEEDIDLFPNPTSGILTIRFNYFHDSAKNYYFITNSLGAKITQGEVINNQATRVDLSKYGTGLYICTILNSTGVIIKKGKIILQ